MTQTEKRQTLLKLVLHDQNETQQRVNALDSEEKKIQITILCNNCL